MSEDTGQRAPAPVRRGLPRVAGAVDSAATGDVAESTAPPSSPPASPPASAAAAPTRRRGLPRTAGEQSPLEVAPVAHPPGLEALAPTATPVTPARRSGLSRPAGAGAPSSGGGDPVTAPPAPLPQARPARDLSQRQPRTALSGAGKQPSGGASSAATKTDLRSRLKSPKVMVLGALGLLTMLALVVLVARWLVTVEAVQSFLVTYPGESHLPANAPVGLPAWLGWQHFLNAFFLVLIIRTGWQVRTQTRPPASWTRNNTGLIKTKNPPKKISLTLWAHLTLDALWALNGLVFIVVLFITGQWMRVVPTSWDVFPNALSSALQYLSLDWPTENGWVNYNSLQLLAYFLTIFVAAPLAGITGLRMSGAWPTKAPRLNKIYPIEVARAIHFPVMLYFVLFVIAHVTLVLATGALRNLNHMFAAQDSGSWVGFWIFFASILVMVGSVFAARPLVFAPIAQLMGKVGR